MKIGEVCLLTRDVPRLADFYRELLGIQTRDEDAFHQTLIAEETMLTVCREDSVPFGQSICLSFTVPDVDEAYDTLRKRGVEIVSPPTDRPWGARNLCFRDPDGNLVYLRRFL